MKSSMALTVSHQETQVAHKLEYWKFTETRDEWCTAYNLIETMTRKPPCLGKLFQKI